MAITLITVIFKSKRKMIEHPFGVLLARTLSGEKKTTIKKTTNRFNYAFMLICDQLSSSIPAFSSVGDRSTRANRPRDARGRKFQKVAKKCRIFASVLPR